MGLFDVEIGFSITRLPDRCRWIRFLSACVPLCFLLCSAGRAEAQTASGLNLRTFLQSRYQSNLFNLPTGAKPVGGGSRSDVADSVGVNASDRMIFGRQSLDVGGQYQRITYRKYSFLNQNNALAHIILGYGIGPLWSGQTGFRYSQSAVSFAESGGESLNMALRRSFFANTYYRRGRPGLQTKLSASRALTTYTLASYNGAKAVVYTLTGEVAWKSPAGWRYGLRESYRNGRYPNRSSPTSLSADTGFIRNDVRALLVRYGANGAPIWSVNLGVAQQRYPHLSANNFTALVGNFRYRIRPYGRLSAVATLSRSVYALATSESSFVLRDKLGVTAKYRISGKTDLLANALYFRDRYQGQGASRIDGNTVAGLGVRWQPRRALSLLLSYRCRSRRSNSAQYDYVDNIVMAKAAVVF